jgi:hypothetical protein
MAMIKALVTSRFVELTEQDRGLVGQMLVDLRNRGFDLEESKKMLRKLRNRMVDPADRAGEPGESTGPAIRPASWGPDETVVF